ncbi:hypothetical protein GGS24DRAFT_185442 [Hypoxylon argillaceum]|nr:hypothetical protein GGS24DRAFT_185442 [Hypoxylon argillaceum]
MAELAGLVLGALPIAIWALEKYSEPFETFHRYHTTIQSFRAQLIIENYQLEKTLSSLGLRKNATRQELQACFEIKFPQICHELVVVVQQMNDVTTELTRSLDVSIDSPSDKTLWNWTRVKNSLNTKKRNKVLESLRNCNEALRRVAEKTELPEEADSSEIQKLKLRFNPQRCASIRDCLCSLHRALGASLCCACPSPHQAAVDLDWKYYESDEMQVYKVAVSYKKTTQPSQHVDAWKKLHIIPHIVPRSIPQVALPDLNQLALASPPRAPSPMTSIKSKMVRFTSFTNLRTLPPSLLTPPTTPSSSSVINGPFSSVVMASGTEVTDLCSAVCTENIPDNLASYFKDPDKDPDKEDYRRFFLVPDQPDLSRITEAFRLKSLISQGHPPAGKQNPIYSLSAKQRYGIAAAVAWSVLHLGGTPWLGEFWSEQQANLFLEKSDQAGTPDSPKPYVSYIFSATPPPPPPPSHDKQQQQQQQQQPVTTPSSAFDELVPNRVIFALGVLLVELCTLDLRSRSRPLLIEDYRAAVGRLDDVRRIAGSAYGDAAERCIKFSFAGRDMYKRFDMAQFRRQFYDGVVAPVQAAYYLMPG